MGKIELVGFKDKTLIVLIDDVTLDIRVNYNFHPHSVIFGLVHGNNGRIYKT